MMTMKKSRVLFLQSGNGRRKLGGTAVILYGFAAKGHGYYKKM
jgi:hypothetical protein